MINIHFRMLGSLVAGAGLIAVMNAATPVWRGNAPREPVCGEVQADLSARPPALMIRNTAPLANAVLGLQCAADRQAETSCPYLAAAMRGVPAGEPEFAGYRLRPQGGAPA